MTADPSPPPPPPTREHRRSVELPVPPERAFAALITPSAIRSWWQADRAVVIAEPGGTWAAAWGADEDDPDYATAATLEVFEPPRRLVLADYRYRARAGRLPFEANFRVEFTLSPADGGGSVLEVVQCGFPAGPEADAHLAGCETGWLETLEGLRRFLAGSPAEGWVTPAVGAAGPLPPGKPTVPLATLLEELASDREDR